MNLLCYRILSPFMLLGSILSNSLLLAAVFPDEEPVILGPEEQAQVIETLKAQWASAHTEVSSAAIKYRASNAAFIKPFVPADRLLPLLEQYNITYLP